MGNKHIRVSDETHHLISKIKFYAGIDIEDFCGELIKEAFTSPVLEKVLMNFLLDRKKVEFVLQKLKET
jgi:hypothetical protein